MSASSPYCATERSETSGDKNLSDANGFALASLRHSSCLRSPEVSKRRSSRAANAPKGRRISNSFGKSWEIGVPRERRLTATNTSSDLSSSTALYWLILKSVAH